MEKLIHSFPEAVSDVPDGAIVLIGGFGGPGGMPQRLILALREQGAKNLTIISNTSGLTGFGAIESHMGMTHNLLVENGQVKKIIASFPLSPSSSRPNAFEMAHRDGKIELELVPQGTLAERIRAGGAGIPAFYTPTGVGTLLARDKETRVIDGRQYILEYALKSDYAFIRAWKADSLGNLVYKGTSRTFNATMATAAIITIVEADHIVEPGSLNPETIVTPGIYVKRIVKR